MLGAYLMVAALFCGITAFLDMGMNGARNAGWAPWGLGLALALGLISGNV